MKIGYARVSSGSRSVEVQVRLLRHDGLRKVVCEVAQSDKTDRAKLRRTIESSAPAKMLVVTRLERLARSTRDF